MQKNMTKANKKGEVSGLLLSKIRHKKTWQKQKKGGSVIHDLLPFITLISLFCNE